MIVVWPRTRPTHNHAACACLSEAPFALFGIFSLFVSLVACSPLSVRSSFPFRFPLALRSLCDSVSVACFSLYLRAHSPLYQRNQHSSHSRPTSRFCPVCPAFCSRPARVDSFLSRHPHSPCAAPLPIPSLYLRRHAHSLTCIIRRHNFAFHCTSSPRVLISRAGPKLIFTFFLNFSINNHKNSMKTSSQVCMTFISLWLKGERPAMPIDGFCERAEKLQTKKTNSTERCSRSFVHC